MAYLSVQGVAVPVLDGAEDAELRLGHVGEAHDGTPRRYVRGGKRRLSIETGPLTEPEARAIAALVGGEGDGWLYEDHPWSCLGAPIRGGAASPVSAGGMPHGTGMHVSTSASWDVVRPDAWTVSYWRSPDGVGLAQHVVGTSAGDWWVDGASVVDPGHLTLSSHSLVLGMGVWAYVRLMPAVVPDAWVVGLGLEDMMREPQPCPRVWMETAEGAGPILALGEVGGVRHEAGSLSLSLALEAL